MKRILWIGFIALVLTGCGEKKVTEEMLIGDWSCVSTDETAKWKNGLFQDYEKLGLLYDQSKNERELVKYFKDNGTLISQSHNGIRKVVNFGDLNAVKEYDEDDFSKIKVSSKLSYVSDDEFNIEAVVEHTYDKESQEKQIELNIKNKVEVNCKRM